MDSDHYIQVSRVNVPVYYNIPLDGRSESSDEGSEFQLHICEQFPNAFVLQLFGMGKKCDHRRIIRFLFTAFTAFKDRDYCLLAISVAIHTSPAMFELLNVMVVRNIDMKTNKMVSTTVR